MLAVQWVSAVRTTFLELLAALAIDYAAAGGLRAGPVHAHCRELSRADLDVILRAGLSGSAEDAGLAAAVCEAYWPANDEPAATAWALLAARADRP
ncbi:hypothetical protein [Streptomyces sp. TLI_171]|uniref:hypothetical protein n=1 Tax=Streptomyces sp. TLI_171 TaxID=1938859 RepID=UPI00117EB998|nr:hypothetical protein [Streptomyces sp. TLI_171]